MLFKEICVIGLKVVAGLGAGLLVYLGLNKPKNNKTDTTARQQQQYQDAPPVQEPQQQCNVNSDPSQSVVNGLQKAQDICGRTFSIIQTLTTATESLSRIFEGGPVGGGYYQQPQSYGNPWTYGQPINMGNGQQWNRISPFIVEVPNTRPYGCNNAYVGPNGGYPI